MNPCICTGLQKVTAHVSRHLFSLSEEQIFTLQQEVVPVGNVKTKKTMTGKSVCDLAGYVQKQWKKKKKTR